MDNVAPTRATCAFEGCDREPRHRGLCKSHYTMQWKGRELRPLLETIPRICRVEGCERTDMGSHRAQLCKLHYDRERHARRLGVSLSLDLEERPCEFCGQSFTPVKRRTTRYCSQRCATAGSRMAKEYGLSGTEVKTMLDAQGGACAICSSPIRFFVARGDIEGINVDHCHSTGKVRGLLCGHCNRGLGLFEDDVDRIRRAIEYLSR